jgi:hypothetical protein
MSAPIASGLRSGLGRVFCRPLPAPSAHQQRIRARVAPLDDIRNHMGKLENRTGRKPGGREFLDRVAAIGYRDRRPRW